ncbi:MAG: ThuA domain-containing protein [Pirellulales bacterium]
MFERLRIHCAWAILLLPAVSPAIAAEPPRWADAKLPVKDGLAVWLDAAAQNAARKGRNEPPIANDAPLAEWLDASGAELNLTQPDAKLQPRLQLVGDVALVSFDAGGAHLSADKLGQQFDNLTVFLVTAPYSNEGNFRGMISIRAAGGNDYTTGINIDQGPNPTARFDTINVEGAGFGGVQNLFTQPGEFARLRRLCLTSSVGKQGVALRVDGEPNGKRDRAAGKMRMNQLVVGARIYGGGEQPQGFYAGAIAEVLIYDRVLSDTERAAVDGYLAAKYSGIETVPPPSGGARPIARVPNPPDVQMHVPGFTVRELPLELPNINNVQYRPDGKLVAVAYNGNVYLLTDTDNDGLEDHAELFFENKGDIRSPIGMDLTPPNYERGQGVFVATKSSFVLIADADGDDQAEKPIVIATGWPESFHNVDALGVAVDPRDHAVYFGLGTPNFADAYVRTPEGKSLYKLDGEKGTIMRVAPDLKSREIVATGIRFPVALRFNPRGDLFCTDQEGATWLANGNPFDELLHIEKGRHYGFPPRHPRHLPDVIDEPSVFDYRPQHQCACGLNFNEPTIDGTFFGPDWWRGDAIVTGYSRGKLYRTKLARTASGYVAQNQLIGTMRMMPPDACVAPDHSLVVAAHSGGPDWGSGPGGMGKLYKIEHADREAPAPALVWAQTPHEVRIAFDRPLDPATLKELASRIAISGGEYADAAERFESVRPGYAVVERQLRSQRIPIDVYNVQLTADRRTLILSTAPHSAAVTYAAALPGLAPKEGVAGVAAQRSPQQETSPSPSPLRGGARGGGSAPELPQLPDVDVQYDLCGVEATWHPGGGEATWQGWLPHLETNVARDFTQRSADHDALWSGLDEDGVLTLRTSLNLRDMLRPAVQPGEKLDYEWPAEVVTLTLTSNCPIEATLDSEPAARSRQDNSYTAQFTLPAGEDKTRNYSLKVAVIKDPKRNEIDRPDRLSLTIHYHTAEDPRPRALQLTRLLLPWAKSLDAPVEAIDNRTLAELKGGNWLRGRAEFFSEQAACSKCHAIRGEGATVGPDLSNLPHRDYASVLRDITQPSFAINPDHTSQIITLATGRVLTGTTRTVDGQLIVTQQDATEVTVARDDIDSIEPSSKSIMPEEIHTLLGPDRLRDLLTFLLVEPPHMPVYGELTPPSPRPIEEVERVLAGSETNIEKKPMHVVLVAGPKDHGLGEHDYPAWQHSWQQLLEMSDGVRVTTADNWPNPKDIETADVMVFYQRGDWTPDRARAIDPYLKRGGGLVYIHWAVDGRDDAAGFAQRIGIAWGAGSKFRHGPLDIEFVPGSAHPIARNFRHVHFHDESYWNGIGDRTRIELLATGIEENQPQPLFWTTEPTGGRVFVSIPGHFSWTFDDPLFRVLLLRGIAWAAGEPVDRFNELATPGARISSSATKSP